MYTTDTIYNAALNTVQQCILSPNFEVAFDTGK